jgi:hypothetical protein
MTLSDIKQSFYTRSFDIAGIENWLSGLALICVLLVAFILYRAIKARRVRYNPYGRIGDAKLIREIMQTAFDQRRPFEVQMWMEAGQRRPTLRCSPKYLGQDNFTIEINGLKSLSDRWIGRQVAVFFRIMSGKDFTYYTFTSCIDGIHMPGQDTCHVTLPMPERLENRQKRSFLRITPPKEFFMGGALWHGANMPPPEKLGEISAWPRPRLLCIPDRLEQFRVLDLSAGGARLRISQEVALAHSLHANSVEQVILMLDLFDPEQRRRLRFWLRCRVQRVWIEHASRDIYMGLQCLAWARPKERPHRHSPAGIEWLRLSGANEVEPLGNWVMRRHLELFREHPPEFYP